MAHKTLVLCVLVSLCVLSVASIADTEGVQPKRQKLDILAMEVEKDSLVPHGTDKFRFDDSKWLGFAVRRGFPFNISVHVNQQLEPDEEFEIGTRSSYSNFTLVKNHGIDAEKQAEKGFYYVLEITTEHDGPIARCTDFVMVVGEDLEKEGYMYPFPIYVLFNPYNPLDITYMPDQDIRKAHFETESSIYFQGESWAVDEYQWYFAQFEPVMLEAAFSVLKGQNASVMSDPLQITQIFTKQMGYWDEGGLGNKHGIINGRWFNASFAGGTNPDDWRSSFDIVSQWYDNNKTPVNWGQCWVFANLGRSMYLSLGMVTRIVTGFGTTVDGSADQYFNGVGTHMWPDHKKHHSVVMFFDKKGAMKYQWGMVWNFHSWTQVYVSSPKEPERYAGWHAVDPTLPGDGPAPVSAIYGLEEDVWQGSSDFISVIHCTIVMKLVDCIPEVYENPKKVRANETTCPVVRTLSVKARGADVILSESTADPTKKEDISSIYVDHTRDAFFPLADGTKPYPEAMAQASLDKPKKDEKNGLLGSDSGMNTDAEFSLEIDTTWPEYLERKGHMVRATVVVKAPPQLGTRSSLRSLTVSVTVNGEIKRVNVPDALGTVMQTTTSLTLNQANAWTAKLPVEVELSQVLDVLKQNTLSSSRLLVQLTAIASSASSDMMKFDTVALPLTPPSPLVLSHRPVPSPASAISLGGAENVLLQTGEAESASHFTVELANPYPHEMRNACVKIKTLHFLSLNIDGEECFEKIDQGSSITVSRPINNENIPNGDYHVSVIMTADGLPTFKAGRTVTVANV